MNTKAMTKRKKPKEIKMKISPEAKEILAAMSRVNSTRFKRPIFYLPASNYVRVS